MVAKGQFKKDNLLTMLMPMQESGKGRETRMADAARPLAAAKRGRSGLRREVSFSGELVWRAQSSLRQCNLDRHHERVAF